MIALRIPRTQPPTVLQAPTVEALLKLAVTDRRIGIVRWTLPQLRRRIQEEGETPELLHAAGLALSRGSVLEVIWHGGEVRWHTPGDAPELRLVLLDALQRNGAEAHLFETAAEAESFAQTYTGHQALAVQALLMQAVVTTKEAPHGPVRR